MGKSNTIAAATESVCNSIADSDREIIQAIVYSPRHSASALQLKALLRLKSTIQANAAIGRLGKKIYRQLGNHPDGDRLGEFQWWTVAATGQKDEIVGFVWSLRPDVVKGLIQAGYSDTGKRIPEELETTNLREGSFKRILVNSYERNPVARARCIDKYGAICIACGFDFEATYGQEATGYIHIHHLVPLSDIGASYEVNPITDLRPVCPNCHALIHISNPPKSIKQVKQLLARNKGPK